MCGRYVIMADEDDIEFRQIINEINKKFGVDYKGSVEVFPTDKAPVYINNNGGREVELFKWGFPGFNNKGSIINARAETILEKPMFKNLVYTRRCAIPVSGFFEWKKTDTKNKNKCLIQLPNAKIFYLAGLYNECFDFKSGKKYMGFVVITTSANQYMRPIHDRMPVILEPGDENAWILSDDLDFINESLKTYEGKLSIYEELSKQ